MKIIYAYRYGIVGGVSTQLLLRQAALTEAGIECHLFFCQDNGLDSHLKSNCKVNFGAEISFRNLCRKVRPDAVLIVDSPELIVDTRSRWRESIPVFLDVHTTTDKGLVYLEQVRVEKLAGMVAPTKYAASLVEKKIPNGTPAVLPNVLQLSAFYPDAKRRNVTSGKVREFIWVGKLDFHKNWQLAVIYTALLRDLLGPVRLSLVGGYTAPDENARKFFGLLESLGLQREVRWIDRISGSDLADLYRDCASSGGAMLVTSRDESFGMAAAEALLCGCPLITNDLPVFREVFPISSQVQRVDIWDAEQVVAAARNLDAECSVNAVESLRGYLQRQYGPESFVEKFRSVIEARI